LCERTSPIQQRGDARIKEPPSTKKKQPYIFLGIEKYRKVHETVPVKSATYLIKISNFVDFNIFRLKYVNVTEFSNNASIEVS